MPSDILKIRTSKLLLKVSCNNRVPKKVHLKLILRFEFINYQEKYIWNWFLLIGYDLGARG